jgi:hypothetical protein
MGVGQRVKLLSSEVAATREQLERLQGQAAGAAGGGLWAQRLGQVRGPGSQHSFY